jgi:hypothetical protein
LRVGIGALRGIEGGAGEFGEGDAELGPEAALEAGVILGAGEDITDKVAEGVGAIEELNHAGGDGPAEEGAAENFASDARGNLEVTGNFSAKACGIGLGLLFEKGLSEKIAGAHGVVETFAGDGIDACGGVTGESPTAADDAASAESVERRRGKDVAVELRAVRGDFFGGDEFIEMAAKDLVGIFVELAADAYGDVVGAGKRPEVAFKFFQEFDFDDLLVGRDEVALGHFKVAGREGDGFGEELIARSAGEYDEISVSFFAAGDEANAVGILMDSGNAGAHGSATGLGGAIEEQPVQRGARINDDGMSHVESGAVPGAGNEFRGADEFFGAGTVEKEGIGLDGFVREAAAAGLFPGEALIVEGDFEAGGGEALAANGASRTTSNDGDLIHL